MFSKNQGAIFGYRHSMLVLGGEFTIDGASCPTIFSIFARHEPTLTMGYHPLF